MKKTTFIFTIILLISLLFTSCGNKSDEASEPVPKVDESGYLEADKSDFSELERMLTEIPELLYAKFDNKESSTEEIINLMIPGYCADGYEFFYGKLEVLSNSKDPEGIFDYGHYKVPEDDINWIVSEIFNVELSAEFEPENSDVYCKDGYYYIGAGDAGLITYKPEIKDYNQLEDGKYEIKVACTPDEESLEDYESEEIHIVAGLKFIKGIRQWIFYNIDGIEFSDEDNIELDEDDITDDNEDMDFEEEKDNEIEASDVASDFIGSWWDKYSSRCGMDITYDSSSERFNIEIKWGCSYDEIAVWSLSGKYSEAVNGINYSGEHYLEKYDSAGNSTKEYEYTNGTGMIYFKPDGYLYWKDNVDGSGDECYFTKE